MDLYLVFFADCRFLPGDYQEFSTQESAAGLSSVSPVGACFPPETSRSGAAKSVIVPNGDLFPTDGDGCTRLRPKSPLDKKDVEFLVPLGTDLFSGLA